MVIALILVVVISLAVSACCSFMEAAILTVPLPHVKHLADKGSRRGKLLLGFKEDMSQPISAILILNTISHTVGASVAGALMVALYGEKALLIFSFVFTLLILYLSEIIPKQVGASYCKKSADLVAFPLYFLIKGMSPLVKLTVGVSRYFGGSAGGEPRVSTQEVLSMAEIGREEGVLDHLEGSVIRNIVGLDRLLVKDILTPRVVVFRLPEESKVEAIRQEILDWAHTRVPIYKEEAPDEITRYVIQRDLFCSFVEGNLDTTLLELSRPLTTVSEFMRADKLLLQMFERRETICSVVDERGGFAGIVTMEDIIEEIVGREIVDEYDLVSDLRAYAQILYNRSKKAQG